MDFIIYAVIVLGAIALIAAVVLYVASKKFAVYEDPRIGQVLEALPGANCGGCGFPGCSGMADALVKACDAGSLDGLLCPVGGQETMSQVADLLGMAVANTDPKVAVVRCNGTCEKRPRVIEYSGLRTCAAMNATGTGETLCGYGCLGCGDCTRACTFDAIHMNEETGLPEVDEEKCVACGACVKACPRHIIELRKKGPKGRRMVVSCMNKDKGAVARKNCSAACIGCGKCEKECKFEAITISNNLSYIDPEKCRLCRKCEAACPTGAILAVNFPVRNPKEEGAKAIAAKSEVTAPVPENKVQPQKEEVKEAAATQPVTKEEEAKA